MVRVMVRVRVKGRVGQGGGGQIRVWERAKVGGGHPRWGNRGRDVVGVDRELGRGFNRGLYKALVRQIDRGLDVVSTSMAKKLPVVEGYIRGYIGG